MFSILALVALPIAFAVTLNYPLMAQEPPVARIGELFIFELLPSTYNSTSTLTFSTSTLPSWLSWSTPSLAFYGTPTIIGEQLITLTATDSTGSVSSDFTLITTNDSVPAVHSSFTTQIANPPMREFASATALPGGTGISIPPYWSFSLGFASDTFRLSRLPNNGQLYWSAHIRGEIGLPTWLTFDNSSYTFNGVAPAAGSYSVVVTGTDYWGYTGAQTSFVIEVGVGEGIELRRGNLTDVIVMTGNAVDYEVDLIGVTMGGQTVPANQLALSLDDTHFTWLTLDGTTLKGTPPDDYLNGTIEAQYLPLTISSTNISNTLSLITWLGIDFLPYFFNATTLPNTTIAPGSAYSFNLAPYLLNTTAAVNATVSPTSAASWLVFHPSNLSLTGTAPASITYSEVDVVFAATLGKYVSTSTLRASVAGVTGPSPTGTAAVPTDTHHSGLSNAAKIGLGVGLALLGILLLLLLLFCCCRRRRSTPPPEKERDDASFIVGSPPQDPFRRSNTLEPPRNLLGEIARFSGLNLRSEPQRVGALGGIFPYEAEKDKFENTPRMTNSSSSFIAAGDVIGADADRPSQEASSFTQTFGSSGSSRASWESRGSFHWSSAENESPRNRMSAAPSIPRPRADFTPRYPRNNSPTALAGFTSHHSIASPDFSEFGSGEAGDSSGSGGTFSSGFPSGPSGLNRFESQRFRSSPEDDETDGEGEPAVVTMAERQSFETRRPSQRLAPKLRPSRERITSPEQSPPTQHSREALALAAEEGMYDDADEARRSMVGRSEVQGLGYPASAIFFGSETGDNRLSTQSGGSTIRAIPSHVTPLSPPLPQVGSFIRHRRNASSITQTRPQSGISNDNGRVVACANETFSMHPQINPPPTVSLSAATWSSAPPSSYRAELEGGGQLPAWLHFDSRELELWGVPSLKHSGDVLAVRIVERMPTANRRSDPMSFGYEPPQEREVGRLVIEIVDRLRSPQFALEDSAHAL